ncbi:pyridoxal phosphate-dependent aminotransferase [Myxococcota bacterium]|nr:pyridoxal phosphate-dependent aminotransferase [Myxococcota bacterium]MBU1537975.1 pyridoxal phosphate-dependent aminotransferase [Myxococcota bacterium]
MELSKRAVAIPPSPIRKLLPLELKAREAGKHIYKLNIGQPDIETPQAFFQALREELPPVLAYGPSQGIAPFRNAVSEYYQKLGIPFSPEEIMITTGGSEAIFFAFLAIANPGDEIIVFEPYYTNYFGFAVYADVNLVPCTLKAENGFHLPPAEQIESLITEKTKAIICCSPNNPTGTVFTREEVGVLAGIAKKHDLYVVSDEVYREFAYDGEMPTSIMAFEEVWDRAIVIDSISKRFSACGARIGNLATKNPQVYQAVLRFGQARLCPATAEQMGAVSLYKLGDDYYASVRDEYMKRRDVIFRELENIPGVVCHMPEGAFYIMVKLPIDNADHFAEWLLTDFSHEGETVMVAPGAGFYATKGMGEDEIRLAYVLEADQCKRATQLLKMAVEQYLARS